MNLDEQLSLFGSLPPSASSHAGFESVAQGLARAERAWAEAEKYQPRISSGGGRSAAGVASKLAARQAKPKLPKFDDQRRAILAALRAAGWVVAEALKVPHATSPDGRARYWFKTQSIYAEGKGQKRSFDMGSAHSLLSDMRIQPAEKIAEYLIKKAPTIAERWAFDR